MASVLDAIQCPQCGFEEAFYEFYTRSGEEDVFCPLCGYRAWTRLVCDRATGLPKRRRDGEWIYRRYERPGYGAYCLAGRSGVSETGCFKKPVTEETIQEFAAHVERYADQLHVEHCWMSRWNAEAGRVEVVFGQLDLEEAGHA